jgi:cytochrome c oxidase cbb3-type subunit 2
MANNKQTGSHEKIEKNVRPDDRADRAAVSVGGLVEIVPLFFQKSTTEPVAGLKPYTALQLAGRDVYIREGCYNCHSQMIRPFRAETERYGHYSVAGEFVYDHPFQWGSKRTGPDLRASAALQRRLAPRAPEQPARRGAGVEHAGLSVAATTRATAA